MTPLGAAILPYLETRYRDPQDRHGASPVEPLDETLPAYHHMTRYLDPQDRHGASPVEPLEETLSAYRGTVRNTCHSSILGNPLHGPSG